MGGVLGDITKIYFGSTEIAAVYDHTSQIWPSAYVGVLVANWVCAGQYTMATVPAGGGSASVTWQLQIYDTNGTLLTTVSVNPTVTISDTTNFAFSNGTWTANDRARNGITTASGTTQPTSAPARSCTLSASVSYTYNGVAVSGSANATMTQNANNVTIGTAQYTNFRFSVQNNKWTSANPGAASQNSATLSAVVDQQSNCTFDSGLAYVYNVYNAATTTDFSFSSESWITFSGATATMASRGTTYSSSQRSAVIYCTLHGSAMGNITVYQAQNVYADTFTRYYDYYIYTSPSSLGSTDTSFQVIGRLYKQQRHIYSSGEHDSWTNAGYDTVTPTITSVKKDGSNYYNYSGNTVTIPANTGGGDIEYSVTANYTDPNYGTWNGYTTSVTQSGISYTYGTPSISFYYPEIPASGGTVYPVVSFSQSRTSSLGDTDTITGTLTQGATSGYASDGSYFSVSFYGSSASPGTFYSSDGRVNIGTRGTDPGAARNAATNCRCYIACHGQGAYSSYTTATQEANIETVTPASNVCSALSLTLSPSTLPAASTNVTVTAKASGTSTTERKDYTSGEHTGGVVTSYSNQTVTLESLKVNGTEQSSVSGFTASNVHSLSTKSYSVVGVYGGKTATTSITQAADIQSDWLTRDYLVSVSIGSNNVSAAGGQASISASGSHTKYKKWLSDNTDVSGSASSVTDTPTLSLVDISSSGVFWLDGTALTHRYMDNAETTDSVKVKATNGSATATTSAITATNSKSYGNISMSYTGSQYIGAGGAAVPFSAECPISWTSGRTGDKLSTLDFTWSFYSKGNNGKRTYTFSDGTNLKVATFGSLGTNTVSDDKDSVVRASYTGAGYAEKTLVERKNIVTGKTLTVNWNITGAPISGVGGIATIKVSSASIQSTYSSGASGSPSSITSGMVLNNTTASGTGFTYTHSTGATSATLKAIRNPSNTNSRSCTLTVSYQDATATITVEQLPVYFNVAYPTGGGQIRGIISNTDPNNSHTFTYYAMLDGTVTVPETTATWAVGESKQVAGGPTGRNLSVVVTKQDGQSFIES